MGSRVKVAGAGEVRQNMEGGQLRVIEFNHLERLLDDILKSLLDIGQGWFQESWFHISILQHKQEECFLAQKPPTKKYR